MKTFNIDADKFITILDSDDEISNTTRKVQVGSVTGIPLINIDATISYCGFNDSDDLISPAIRKTPSRRKHIVISDTESESENEKTKKTPLQLSKSPNEVHNFNEKNCDAAKRRSSRKKPTAIMQKLAPRGINYLQDEDSESEEVLIVEDNSNDVSSQLGDYVEDDHDDSYTEDNHDDNSDDADNHRYHLFSGNKLSHNPKKQVANTASPPLSPFSIAKNDISQTPLRTPLSMRYTPHRTPLHVNTLSVPPLTSGCSSKKKCTGIKFFSQVRVDLTAQHFQEFNRVIFKDRLPKDMLIRWSKTLNTTAGRTLCKRDNHDIYTASIELSTKVL